ncbi:MAG TPA: hypothetical protein VK619_16210, partial [Pyrinomonadaceae bacterium]|nr:hypothetical protein [Pyrinomonadaceae bacterium]
VNEDAAGQNSSSSSQNAPSPSSVWREPSPQSARRIALAYELLERGDAGSALQIVLPVLSEGVNTSLMIFLLRLHERDNVSADMLLSALIEAERNNAESDANTVLLLSTPIVSPGLLIAIDERGSLQLRPVPRAQGACVGCERAPIAPMTLAAFYSAVASILLHDFSDHANAQREAIARYFAITRLLPFFMREAQQFVPELQARANSLAEEIETSRRDYLKAQSEVTPAAPEHTGDPLRTQADQLAHARTETERQHVYLSMVKTAVGIRAWDRARRAAENLEDLNMRHTALSFIALNQIADISHAYADERENDYDPVVKFVDSADVSPLARAWGYAQAAEIAARKRTRKQRAAELLDEAGRWANRVDAGTPERVAAYAVVASSAARVSEERAWGALREAIKSANSVEDFSGEQVTIAIYAVENADEEREPDFSFTSDAFRLDRIFAKMARLNFDKALVESRALENGVPRAIAQIAVARAVIERAASNQ